jgi:Fe(II)/alpha-ketoglutarate-dependent arginine beta-hydroxylase
MEILEINREENDNINVLLVSIMNTYSSPGEEPFLLNARTLAAGLPVRLLEILNRFRCSETNSGALILKGFSVSEDMLEATPDNTGKEIDELSAKREGFYLMLLSSFLGDAMGWSNQRNGGLINNIIPLKSDGAEQLSTGSLVELDWHTEEAFHPYRADYLALMCLRNHDNVPTVVASVCDIQLDAAVKEVLFEERYVFETDKNFSGTASGEPKKEAVLFGDFSAPYIRIDPSFMKVASSDDTRARNALDIIAEAIKSKLQDVSLNQGDVIIIDNYRVVHGRKSFVPKFDGKDRWLKRINITLDMRKSRAARQHLLPCTLITN